MAIKKCYSPENAHIYQYLKKLKETGTVANLPASGAMFILPLHTTRRMIREAKNCPKITVGESQRKVASWGHQVSKTPNLLHHKRKHVECAKRYWNFLIYGQMK